MDLINHLTRQRQFSERTFGPYTRPGRTEGVIKHLEKEVGEVRKDPADLLEWIDCVILAFEGALSQGYTPTQVARALEAKQDINESRTWPDWRTTTPGTAIEHVRTPEPRGESDTFGGPRLKRHEESVRLGPVGCGENGCNFPKCDCD